MNGGGEEFLFLFRNSRLRETLPSAGNAERRKRARRYRMRSGDGHLEAERTSGIKKQRYSSARWKEDARRLQAPRPARGHRRARPRQSASRAIRKQPPRPRRRWQPRPVHVGSTPPCEATGGCAAASAARVAIDAGGGRSRQRRAAHARRDGRRPPADCRAAPSAPRTAAAVHRLPRGPCRGAGRSAGDRLSQRRERPALGDSAGAGTPRSAVASQSPRDRFRAASGGGGGGGGGGGASSGASSGATGRTAVYGAAASGAGPARAPRRARLGGRSQPVHTLCGRPHAVRTPRTTARAFSRGAAAGADERGAGAAAPAVRGARRWPRRRELRSELDLRSELEVSSCTRLLVCIAVGSSGGGRLARYSARSLGGRCLLAAPLRRTRRRRA